MSLGWHNRRSRARRSGAAPRVAAAFASFGVRPEDCDLGVVGVLERALAAREARPWVQTPIETVGMGKFRFPGQTVVYSGLSSDYGKGVPVCEVGKRIGVDNVFVPPGTIVEVQR